LLLVLVFSSAPDRNQALVNAVKKSGATQVSVVGPCIVCSTRDSLIVGKLAGIHGINSITTAMQVTNEFSNVVSAIVKAGGKEVKPCEKFYIQVIQAAKKDYVERDIEFVATGALVEKLTETGALPARNEREADTMIQAVVGKKWAYICVRNKI
jgi:adenylyl- and sulfurtransferase ThiI